MFTFSIIRAQKYIEHDKFSNHKTFKNKNKKKKKMDGNKVRDDKKAYVLPHFSLESGQRYNRVLWKSPPTFSTKTVPCPILVENNKYSSSWQLAQKVYISFKLLSMAFFTVDVVLVVSLVICRWLGPRLNFPVFGSVTFSTYAHTSESRLYQSF